MGGWLTSFVHLMLDIEIKTFTGKVLLLFFIFDQFALLRVSIIRLQTLCNEYLSPPPHLLVVTRISLLKLFSGIFNCLKLKCVFKC